LKKQFLTGEPLIKPELYASTMLNPDDNKDNLPSDYISDILDTLPDKQRARFKLGLWVKAEGVVYEKFDETMILDDDAVPKEFDRYAAGQDFGLNITNVKIGIKDDFVYVLDDYGAFNMTTKSFNNELVARNWFDVDMPVYCDPAGGEHVAAATKIWIPNNNRLTRPAYTTKGASRLCTLGLESRRKKAQGIVGARSVPRCVR
jgi:hypothetical protein